jgi:hypothetical protein
MPDTTHPGSRPEPSDRAWDAFCTSIYVAREPLRREEARNAEERCADCGAPKRAWLLCDRWACPVLDLDEGEPR